MLSIQFSYQKSDMHAPLSRQRCGLVIFTAETACADIRYDESLYDGTRFTLLLHLTCWHMWASHTASITVHALSINDAPGDARLAAAVASTLAPVEGRCRRRSEDRRCLQTISAKWRRLVFTFELLQRRDDDDRGGGVCRAVWWLRCPVQLPRKQRPWAETTTPAALNE